MNWNKPLTWGMVSTLGIIVAGCASISPQATSLTVRAMTFNLRYASEQPPHAWSTRRPLVANVIRNHTPDVIGTQEGLYSQIIDIAGDLPDYDWIGQGRAGGTQDEYCAIFYRRDRFDRVAEGHFWLSDTPDVVGSMTWGNRYRRMTTWVRLKDHQTSRTLLVVNTHWDHEVAEARQKSAELIRRRLTGFPADEPLLVLGDFNCAAGQSTPFATLLKGTGLVDTWEAARDRRPSLPVNTYHAYRGIIDVGERIDWVLARRPLIVNTTEIVTAGKAGQWPSDHFPVFAEISW
jgi:endonuclease/exonuclease/phosphatase family metal-dependent hydrolase